MAIILDSEVARELIVTKINSIQNALDIILLFWNQSSVEDFIENSNSGAIDGSMDDLKSVHQLTKDLEKFQFLLDSI